MGKLYRVKTLKSDLEFRTKLGFLGYEYKKYGILNKVISPEIFLNVLLDKPLRQIERLIEELIDQSKRIKLHYSFALKKDDFDKII